MTDLGPILDYASPRKGGLLRLPAVSRLAVSVADGRVTIEESLAGQAEAVFGLIFGAVVVCLCTAAATSLMLGVTFGGPRHLHRDWTTGDIMAALALAEGATMVGVVQQTWRRTVLTAEYDELRLSFLSPLSNRHHRWTGNDVADVLVVATPEAADGRPLGELLITRVVGGEVRLFTDHPAHRLDGMARALHDMLRDGRADPPPGEILARASAAAVRSDVAPQAERTTGQLIDVHRKLRQRQGGSS